MTARPTTVRLRAYKVGFGDCLLLTVGYGSALPDGGRQRHMLIDLGSRHLSDDGPKLPDIAAKIAEHCDGRLDVLVATHRHLDHISGFGDSRAKVIIDGLTPRAVIRPWTDVPEQVMTHPEFGLDDSQQRFIAQLDGMHRLADQVGQLAFDNDVVAARARQLAELGIKNAAAVAMLDEWSKHGRGRYVKAGQTVNIDDEMPGVQVRVLGPPTIAEVPRLTSYAKDSEGYWLQMAMDDALVPELEPVGAQAAAEALEIVAQPGGAGAAEWLLRTLAKKRLSQGLDVVECFDDVLNNTSVILLVTIGKRTLLLAGDAQAENWSLSLDQALGVAPRSEDPELRRQLAGVDVYKVGHHGSRNATPARLYDLWKPRIGSAHPLVSVLTTKRGVYEKSTEGKVPKPNLVAGLRKLGPVHNTDRLPKRVWWFDVTAATSGDARFVFSQGPTMP